MALILSLAIALAGFLSVWRVFFFRRSFLFNDIATGNRIGVELPWRWKRVFDMSASIIFENRRDGSKLLISPQPVEFTPNFIANWHKCMREIQDERLKSSVEKSIKIHDFVGVDTRGHYLWSADRKVKLGDFQFGTTGMVVLASHRIIHFSILSHIAPPTGIKEALDGVRSMLLIGDGPRVAPVGSDVPFLKMSDEVNQMALKFSGIKLLDGDAQV